MKIFKKRKLSEEIEKYDNYRLAEVLELKDDIQPVADVAQADAFKSIKKLDKRAKEAFKEAEKNAEPVVKSTHNRNLGIVDKTGAMKKMGLVESFNKKFPSVNYSVSHKDKGKFLKVYTESLDQAKNISTWASGNKIPCYIRKSKGVYNCILKEEWEDEDILLGKKVIIRKRYSNLDGTIGTIHSYEGTNYDDKVEVERNGHFYTVNYEDIEFLDDKVEDDEAIDRLQEGVNVTKSTIKEEWEEEDVCRTGIAQDLNYLIKDELEAVEGYNSVLATWKDADKFPEIIAVLKDIVDEEMLHIGQLQRALELVSPNAKNIQAGVKEAEEQIVDEAEKQKEKEIEKAEEKFRDKVDVEVEDSIEDIEDGEEEIVDIDVVEESKKCKTKKLSEDYVNINKTELEKEGIQYFGTKNKYNYDKIQLRIDHDNKTYQLGVFTHISKRETVSTPELKRIIKRLKEMGYEKIVGIDVVEESLDDEKVNKTLKSNRKLEDVEKLPNGKWANVGKDGKADSGTFKTKKEAEAQMKAMYANGYKESIKKEGMKDTLDAYVKRETSEEEQDTDKPTTDESLKKDLKEEEIEKGPFQVIWYVMEDDHPRCKCFKEREKAIEYCNEHKEDKDKLEMQAVEVNDKDEIVDYLVL